MPNIDTALVKQFFPELTNISLIKSGGQKTAFLATGTAGNKVVVKVVHPTKTFDERIQREINIVSSMQFPNVPLIYDCRLMPYAGLNYFCIIEQCIEGNDLRSFLPNRLSFNELLALMESLLTTIAELETHRIVHRDIKPDNIIYASDGSFWLIDFGIARDLNSLSLTSTAAAFGPHTAGYAAPEQFRNIKQNIDSKADLFSIGVVAYEMYSGIQPFQLNTNSPLGVLRNTESMRVPPLSIPEDPTGLVAKFIAVLMSTFPSRRPRSAELARNWFLDILTQLQQGA